MFRTRGKCYHGHEFMAVFNNKTTEFRRREPGMTKPSITENFINEPIPEDKAASTLCAAVRKSNAMPRSLRLPPLEAAYIYCPHLRSYCICAFSNLTTRDRFLRIIIYARSFDTAEQYASLLFFLHSCIRLIKPKLSHEYINEIKKIE